MSKARRSGEVDALLAKAGHPLQADIDYLRGVILGVDPDIGEGVKWNGPSYRLGDDFATVHMRATDGVCVILHTGAKKRAKPLDMTVEDPGGLLEWLAKDRCMARLGSGKTLRANRKAFEAVLRAWIGKLAGA